MSITCSYIDKSGRMTVYSIIMHIIDQCNTSQSENPTQVNLRMPEMIDSSSQGIPSSNCKVVVEKILLLSWFLLIFVIVLIL